MDAASNRFHRKEHPICASGVAVLLLNLLILLVLPSTAYAQKARYTQSVDYPPPSVTELCVDLDATASVDPAAGPGPLTFRWQMGDGTTLTGLTVSHCYAARRLYTVQLDVVDEKTGEVRAAEKLIPVDFTQEVFLDFTATPTTVQVGRRVVFDAVDSQLPSCENIVFLWDFRDGDGIVSNKRQVEHIFRRPGQYLVCLALRATGPNSCPDRHCVSRVVAVVAAP